MIEILPSKTDDKIFVGLINQILQTEISFVEFEDIFITKVDHWFDLKWRAFSHKMFGELGVWREPLRIPPFIPDRIVEETYFQKVGKSYVPKDLYQLHIYQPSSKNAERKINRKSALYIWFSGNTLSNSQGSLMIYKFTKELQNSWYVSFIKKTEWQIYKTDNISKAEVKGIIKNDNFALIM
jgi:hypothetical protein